MLKVYRIKRQLNLLYLNFCGVLNLPSVLNLIASKKKGPSGGRQMVVCLSKDNKYLLIRILTWKPSAETNDFC